MTSIQIPERSDFWKWLAIFAYRRWCGVEGRKPVGIPGNRDPEHPCDAYAPRPQRLGDWADCMTDGHYLCVGCAHRALPAVLARQGDVTPKALTPIRWCNRAVDDCYSEECRACCVADRHRGMPVVAEQETKP